MGIFMTPAVFVACTCCKDCIYIMAVQELWEGIKFHSPLLFQVATPECRGQNRSVEKGMACRKNYNDDILHLYSRGRSLAHVCYQGEAGLFHEQKANAILRTQLWGAPGHAGEVNAGSIQGSRMSSASQVKSGAAMGGLMEGTLL